MMTIKLILLSTLMLAVVVSAKLMAPTTSEHWYNTQEKVGQQQPVSLLFALSQRNLDWLEQTLYAVSDPTSPSYGQHLDVEEIADKIAPFHHQINKVLSWLSSYGVTGEVPRGRDWVTAETTVGKAEEMLECEFFIHKNRRTGTEVMRAGEYTIPSSLDDIIDFVAGLNTYPFVGKPISSYRAVPSSVDPDTLYSLYSVSLPSAPTKGSSQAVVEFSGANFSPADLQTFFSAYQPSLSGQQVEQIYGSNNPNGIISLEANLDVQYIMALGAFVNTSDYVQPPSFSIMDAFLDYTYVVGNQSQPPLVHSISWGEYGGSYDNATDQRINVEFQKMGVRGISILLASGDNGVGCGDDCKDEEYDFPSSPYLTMVGATELENNVEIAATLSAGGFSLDFEQPAYQSAAVSAYLNSGVPLPPQSYDPNGRAYPDVAAIGMNVQIIHRGRNEAVDGTSCSAPIFAGIISLLNDQRLAAGKSPLGFLNPWFYQNPSMFNDITSGSNPYHCCEGFQATTGWDPVTGLGSPLFPALLKSALSLP